MKWKHILLECFVSGMNDWAMELSRDSLLLFIALNNNKVSVWKLLYDPVDPTPYASAFEVGSAKY